MPLADKSTGERIRELNDAFRKTLDPTLGKTVCTAGVTALPSDVRAMAIRKVATFDDFSADNDPQGEHDFGSFEVQGETYFFKHDYYALDMDGGSEDPADPEKTTRVLTIMRANEY